MTGGLSDQQAKSGRLDPDRRLLGIHRLFPARTPVLSGASPGEEWVQFIGSIVIFMLGTANVRLAAIRARQQLAQKYK
jgi:hypothetical protein